jgi:hypothetical protein
MPEPDSVDLARALRVAGEWSRAIWALHVIHTFAWTVVVGWTVWYGLGLGWTVLAAFFAICFVIGGTVVIYGRRLDMNHARLVVGLDELLNDIRQRLGS